MGTIRQKASDAIASLLAVMLAPRVTIPRATYSILEAAEPTPGATGPDGSRSASKVRHTEQRLLQLSIGLAASVPAAAGAWGVIDASGSGASNERYLWGVLLAIGIAFWMTIPRINRMALQFRLLSALVIAGGLCRLFGVALGDAPSNMEWGALGMELFVTPMLCLWQLRFSQYRRIGEPAMPRREALATVKNARSRQ